MLTIAMVAEHPTSRSERDTVPRVPHVTAISTALADAGHEVSVHLGQGAASSDTVAAHQRIRISPWSTGESTDDVVRALAAAWTNDRPDVVHAHDQAALVASAAAERLGIPFVHSLHTAEGTVVRPDARVIVPCTARLSQLISEGVRRQCVDVVPYGVDIDHLTPDGFAAPKRLRHRLVVNCDRTARSGLATAIAALPALPDTELVILGGPTDRDHARQLRRYVGGLGVSDRVTLMGSIGVNDRPHLLRSADVAVCVPSHEMYDMTTVLEAMACGVAVVAANVGGLADTVVDGVTGTLVPTRHPRALAVAVRRLLARPALCEQYGAAGRDRAWARYCWARIANDTLAAYGRAGATDPARAAREVGSAKK